MPRCPQGFEARDTRVYRVADYRGRGGRAASSTANSRANRYSLMGIVCSGEPLMTKWKWALALRIPAKVFVINENGDYFWLDRQHLEPIRQFVLLRAGLAGAGRGAHPGARVFVPVHFAVSATLCNGRSCPQGACAEVDS